MHRNDHSQFRTSSVGMESLVNTLEENAGVPGDNQSFESPAVVFQSDEATSDEGSSLAEILPFVY